ncbi:hypothetical protein L2E82_16820 [Cichorium intybus]|uniref:Uncharacterized protein n=1 Tax=Cichorium intybus TaxID=13427 RepID=A0ACB9F626_CICIN|nr:hypothetical protein L2E82_16820 [Cichorium intybus]
MGQGEEVNTRSPPAVEIQERGEIYFFYRPKVNKEEAHSSDDVQRMYIVLRPESGETSTQVKQQEEEEEEEEANDDPPPTQGGHGAQEVNIEKNQLLRFIVMGQKKLPDLTQKSRPLWGFVELVTTKIEDVKDALKGGEYDTAKSGHRHKAAARAVGEGIYRILRHHSGKKMHTHLIYKLEFPSEEGQNEPQEALNIEKEASFLIQIKNPTQKGQFRGLSKKKRAVFPAHLQGQFGKLRYHAADPPDFLNYEGCEFLLIAASDDIEEELGLELKGEVEETQDASCSDLLNTFGETSSANALLTGIWV